VNPSPLDVDGIFAALDRHGVDYVLVGSLALAAHGYVRATRDIDIVPSPDLPNLERLAAALRELDARLIGGELLPEVSLDADSLAGGANFPVDTRYGRLDLMQDKPGIPAYAELASAAFEAEVGEHRIPVCSREDLIAMKRAADREIDRIDLARLRELDG
jgi:hypothetical protein